MFYELIDLEHNEIQINRVRYSNGKISIQVTVHDYKRNGVPVRFPITFLVLSARKSRPTPKEHIFYSYSTNPPSFPRKSYVDRFYVERKNLRTAKWDMKKFSQLLHWLYRCCCCQSKP